MVSGVPATKVVAIVTFSVCSGPKSRYRGRFCKRSLLLLVGISFRALLVVLLFLFDFFRRSGLCCILSRCQALRNVDFGGGWLLGSRSGFGHCGLGEAGEWIVHVEHLAEACGQLARRRLSVWFDSSQAIVVTVITIFGGLSIGGGLCPTRSYSLLCFGGWSSLEVDSLLVDPDRWELPDFEALVFCTGHQTLFVLVPLHRRDG